MKRVAQESTTVSGIIIPDSAKEKPITGLVLAVGAGKVDDAGNVKPLDVGKGELVLFGKYAGTEIKIEGLEHTIQAKTTFSALSNPRISRRSHHES